MPSKPAQPDHAAPKHLSARAKTIWTSLVPAEVSATGQLVLLQAALEMLDRIATCQAAIDKSGLTTKMGKSGVIHVHPLLRLEHETQIEFVRAWAKLGLCRSSTESLLVGGL